MPQHLDEIALAVQNAAPTLFFAALVLLWTVPLGGEGAAGE